MKISVLSGKGGTGKTFLSVNLAQVAKDSVYIDCDVEEPNGNLFLKVPNPKIDMVDVLVPVVDQDKCNGCKECVEFCQFNALAYVGGELKIFNELCHSCGGCTLLCPQKALKEVERNIGKVESGFSNEIKVKSGELNIGEATGVPIIEKLLEDMDSHKNNIVDCPPGSSCQVMESIKGSDYCLLVIEPTKFGIHNINLVYQLVKLFDIPYGAVINKDMGDSKVAEEFCKKNNINLLNKIPYNEEIGKLNSNGYIVAKENEEFRKIFENILGKIQEEVQQ
ncbi:MAG: 4Fe-4S binding protein [Tissierellales bacterium]|jgi:MinD superfamily P-loop ATPase|nr:4Fe-4S binding protein [Tissierellales bacterium]